MADRPAAQHPRDEGLDRQVPRGRGEEFGTSDKLSVVLLRDGWVADSLEDVERDWWPVIRAEHWFYF